MLQDWLDRPAEERAPVGNPVSPAMPTPAGWDKVGRIIAEGGSRGRQASVELLARHIEEDPAHSPAVGEFLVENTDLVQASLDEDGVDPADWLHVARLVQAIEDSDAKGWAALAL